LKENIKNKQIQASQLKKNIEDKIELKKFEKAL